MTINKENVSRAFKAYDIRGRIPDELNDEVVKLIGNSFVQFLREKEEIKNPIIIGYDVRPTSKKFSEILAKGIIEAGVDIIDIGLTGTDMVYFATATLGAAGGIMITASHNPPEYNGLKLVREDAIPISGDTGLINIKEKVFSGKYYTQEKKGIIKQQDVMKEYIEHVINFIDVDKIKPMKVVMNAGNGCAGVALKPLMEKIPKIEVIKQFWDLDGTFPNGIPNPLLLERRKDTTDKVLETKSDLGVAWDGDFDRCFFFDEKGNFIEGYYLVALFGDFYAKKYPGSKIIHDPRLVWATIEAVEAAGGITVANKSGHTFIKERMRKEDAIYAGEMSAHHYFKDNFYADNGMIPMLLLFQIISESGEKLSDLVKDWMARYPVSGEINVKVKSPKEILGKIEEKYVPQAKKVSKIDGISLEYDNWRFNLRISNTEPVIRLNVETRGNTKLMEEKRDEILKFIKECNKN